MTPWADLVGEPFAARGGAPDAVDGVVPAWVVRPGSIAEAQAVVRAAADAGAALIASGLGAHLDRGAPPRRLDVLLRLDRLVAVVDHQAGDMTVTAEAGCPLPALDAVLARAGQWLPLDPPRREATTVGGLIAANLSGPLRASQGTVRDLLLGLRVIGADGALVSSGGRVVKNVAGYDLPKLHVGALGTVGVIVEATLKVRPRPEREEAVVVACRTAREAAEAALAVRDAIEPLWLEVVGPGGLPEGPGDATAVAVGLGGIAEETHAARARVTELAAARGLRALAVPDGVGLRQRLADFPLEPAAAVLRAAALPTDVGGVLEAIADVARDHRVGARTLAHGASGVVRAAFAEPTTVDSIVRALRPRVESLGGSLVVERATAAAKDGLDVWGDPGPGRGLMRRLKAAFDPAGILAPGRFVDGL